MEMAELEDLEHQEELRSLLQDRISGEATIILHSQFSRSLFLTGVSCSNALTQHSTQHRRCVAAVLLSSSAKQRQCVDGAKLGALRSSPASFRRGGVLHFYSKLGLHACAEITQRTFRSIQQSAEFNSSSASVPC